MKCDRCGVDITDWPWKSGNCTNCGDNLCEVCAGGFNDDGECAQCVSAYRYYVHKDIFQFEIINEIELLLLPVEERGEYRLIERAPDDVKKFLAERLSCKKFMHQAIHDAGLLL